jgi:V/A-type H+-transporting ATPase subunit E
MSAPADQLQGLERAIMARAEELAREFHDKARRQRDGILRDAAERLQLAEEREVLVAKAEAERHFRRVTQAGELHMQGRLDQLRWEMVQTVQSRLAERMRNLRDDRPAYRNWLIEMLREAALGLPEGPLVAAANSDDHSWLAADWEAVAAAGAPDRELALAPQPIAGTGGLIIGTRDGTAQVDNRFEGRLVRLEAVVQRSILTHLFPADGNALARSGGPQ